MTLTEKIVKHTSLPFKGVEATIKLLDEGATIPFICRYRKESTGSLDEIQVRNIETALKFIRDFESRKEFIKNAIEKENKYTETIAHRLDSAKTINELEDIYLPFKQKKHTRASIAREKGLEKLAKLIMVGNTNPLQQARNFIKKDCVFDEDEALEGAQDIIAEWASESSKLRNLTRKYYLRNAKIVCKPAKGKENLIQSTPYSQYSKFSQPIKKISSHQWLAIKRGERQGLLKIKFEIEGEEFCKSLSEAYLSTTMRKDCFELASRAIQDSFKRLLRPSIENELSSSLKENADKVAIKIFADNLRQLLLNAPLKGKNILAIDPGFRTGCKIVALDSHGNLLEDSVIYPFPPKQNILSAEAILKKIITNHKIDVIALGNGTASRETELFLKERELFNSDLIFIVSEDGASVYSASEIGRREFPDKDITVRGAVSIGRRLIDPLAELVKIDPKSIGVGQYQHDVDQKLLKESLDFTVISCVNSVGVNVNTASESLLSYISGIGPSLASSIVNYRSKNGNFRSRKELKNIPRLGEKAYELAAGFLRVSDGCQPLDNTGIHPESYHIVEFMANSIGTDVLHLLGNKELLEKIDISALAAKGIGGVETMTDIINELKKPGHDSREDFVTHKFADGVASINDLREGMVLPGVVTNITNFGAFVDIGVHQDGLVHISKMSHNYVCDPMQIVKLHQPVQVKVLEVDYDRKRISLSMIDAE